MSRRRQRIFENKRLLLTRILGFSILPIVVLTSRPWPRWVSGSEAAELIGFSLIAVGVIGRLWATIHVAGRKSWQLVTTGPYSLCRHPLYFFGFVLGLGIVSAFENLLLLIPFVAFYLGCYGISMVKEERALAGRFGSDYESYRKRVPRFVPAFWKYRRGGDSDGRLWVDERLVHRVLYESAALMLIIPLVEIIENLRRHGVLPLHLGS